jgi:hypothetical protein
MALAMRRDSANIVAIGRRGAIFPFTGAPREGVVGFGFRLAGFFSHGSVLAG